MTVDEFIDALGGNTAVAKIAGVGSSAVSNWRKFGRLPPRVYFRLRDAACERGIADPQELFAEPGAPRSDAAD